MTRIKICGLTNADDVRMAVALGADALGFIGVPDTPRYVTPEEMREATRGLPPFVQRVVVVRERRDAVGYDADAVQYYAGDDNAVGQRPIRVFRVKDTASLQELHDYRYAPNAILLDTFHESSLGGVGQVFDWGLAITAKQLFANTPIILAGGLTPENVGEAIRTVRPYAVDVSSGVERQPRYKDYTKLSQFIVAVQDADREIAVKMNQD